MISELWAAVSDGKIITAQEPVLTWNLFLTIILIPLSVTLLGSYLKNIMAKHARDREKYEEEKEKHTEEWRTAIGNTICGIKDSLGEMRKEVVQKVEIEDCNNKSDKKWKMINHHSHDEKGRVVIG